MTVTQTSTIPTTVTSTLTVTTTTTVYTIVTDTSTVTETQTVTISTFTTATTDTDTTITTARTTGVPEFGSGVLPLLLLAIPLLLLMRRWMVPGVKHAGAGVARLFQFIAI